MAFFLRFPQGSQRIYKEGVFFYSHTAFTSCRNSSLNEYIPQKQLQKMLGFLFSLLLAVLQTQLLSKKYPEHAHSRRKKSLHVYPFHEGIWKMLLRVHLHIVCNWMGTAFVIAKEILPRALTCCACVVWDWIPKDTQTRDLIPALISPHVVLLPHVALPSSIQKNKLF